MRITCGFKQCPCLLLQNKSVLSMPTVWLRDYAFNSKSDSPLCGCSDFDQSISGLCGLMRIKLGFEQCPGLLFQKVYSLSRLCGWETMLSLQKVTADCVAVQFLNNQ